MLSEVGSNQPINKINEAKCLADALGQADNYCRKCTTASPMVCVERCDVWRVKHEILEIKRVTSEDTHMCQLLNVIKNKRRVRILNLLCERSHDLKELQKRLRQHGFHHSQLTIIEAYLKPLIRVGLVREDGARYKATFYGHKVHGTLKEQDYLCYLPIHSCCYEEVVLRELNTPKTFTELSNHVPKKSLSRILMRLRAKRLLAQKAHPYHVFYHQAKGRPKTLFTPTEKRVFEAIPQDGIAVHTLASVVGINIRRTYKYLRRLREKKLVFPIKTRRTYEVTLHGREVLRFLDDLRRLAESNLTLPVAVVQKIP